jgi:hypothetical protein
VPLPVLSMVWLAEFFPWPRWLVLRLKARLRRAWRRPKVAEFGWTGFSPGEVCGMGYSFIVDSIQF